MSTSNQYNVSFASAVERRLSDAVNCEHSQDHFPTSFGGSRFDVYKQLKQKLFQTYFRDVNAGLAVDGNGAAFTHHDISHVDELIRQVGSLLGVSSNASTPAIEQLKPYEYFVLLVACLVHDAGNLDGRKGHAQRARKVLRSISEQMLTVEEINLIAKIAEAHGGKTRDGDKDTISHLNSSSGVGSVKVRPQLLAAIVRLADELSESELRASSRTHPNSTFPNHYCRRIGVAVDYDDRSISLSFTLIDDDAVMEGVDEDGEEMYFLDYICNRIVKTELERRYCNRFMRGFCSYDQLKVEVNFLKDDDVYADPIHFILAEDGYPSEGDDIREKVKFDVQKIAEKYRQLDAE